LSIVKAAIRSWILNIPYSELELQPPKKQNAFGSSNMNLEISGMNLLYQFEIRNESAFSKLGQHSHLAFTEIFRFHMTNKVCGKGSE